MVDPVWTADVSSGAWLRPRLEGWGDADGTPVTSVVPSGFEAYARVLHPVGHEDDEEQVTWAQVCEATGRTAHALMQWEAISGTRHTRRTTTAEWQGDSPDPGSLQPPALAAVLDVLERWTSPQGCVMALWDGFGWVDGQGAGLYGVGGSVELPPACPPEVSDGPRLQLHARDYLLLTGSLRSAQHLGHRTPDELREQWPWEWLARQSPNLLWPEDRSWCLATEIDFDSTLVGGAAALVDALVASPAVEAYAVPPGGDLSLDGDQVNELHGRRRR